VTPEQRIRLEQLRRRRTARAEYIASGGIRVSKLSLSRGELTLTQYIRTEIEREMKERGYELWKK
jgi:hypothetical protein